MADEVLSRVVCRNDAQREKQQSMRGAILDIILNSYTIKRAKEEHKVGESTLRRYTREVKVRTVHRPQQILVPFLMPNSKKLYAQLFHHSENLRIFSNHARISSILH